MNTIEFYINNFAYVSDIENLDFSFIPSMLRRRLSPLNKTSFYVIDKCLTDEVDNFVYSSQYGEFDKLKKLIDSFITDNCVSPTMFSSSVHNATIGAYLHSKQLNKPYVAISATENTLSMGLLQTIINPYKTNLFCYSDYIDEKPYSIALLISDKPEGKRYTISIENNEQNNNIDEKSLLISLLKNEITVVHFNNYKIEVL